MELTIKIVHDYMEYCKKWKNLDWKTIKAYNIDLRQFIEFLGREKLPFQKEALTAYTAWMNERFKPRTVRRKLASIRALTTWLLDEELLEHSPFERLSLRVRQPLALPRTVPFRVVEQMLTAAHRNRRLHPNDKGALRGAAVLEMLFATGMRVSELCRLKAGDVDLNEGVIRVYGKNRKERVAYVTNREVLSVLRQYAREVPTGCHGTFFRNRHGKRLSEDSVRRMIRKYGEMTDCSARVTPHMLRHTVATQLLEADVDIRIIQKLLGHASILTTQIYTQVVDTKQRDTMMYKHPRNQFSISQV